MEAMTAVTVAALTVYDMCKAVDRGIRVDNVRLYARAAARAATSSSKRSLDPAAAMVKIRLPSLDRLIGRGGTAPPPPEMLVVGLGNPGDRYRDTRHNVGFRCVDRIAGDHAIELSRRQRRALIGEGVIDGHPVVVARPRTFVNRSGEAVAYLLTRYAATPDRLLSSTTTWTFRWGSSVSGHRAAPEATTGVKSIIDAVGTREFRGCASASAAPPEATTRWATSWGHAARGPGADGRGYREGRLHGGQRDIGRDDRGDEQVQLDATSRVWYY